MTIAQDIVSGINAIFGGDDKETINSEIVKNARILARSTVSSLQQSVIYEFADKSELIIMNNEIYEKFK